MARDAPGATAARPTKTKPIAHGFVICSQGYAHEFVDCAGPLCARLPLWLWMGQNGEETVSESTTVLRYVDVQALGARAVSRERVILAARDDDPARIDHIERHDVVVVPKEDWIQILIWLTAFSVDK